MEKVQMIDGETPVKLEPFKIRPKINSSQDKDIKTMLWVRTPRGQLIIRKKKKNLSPNLNSNMLNLKLSNLFNNSNRLHLPLSNIQEIHQEESRLLLFDQNVQVVLSDK